MIIVCKVGHSQWPIQQRLATWSPSTDSCEYELLLLAYIYKRDQIWFAGFVHRMIYLISIYVKR